MAGKWMMAFGLAGLASGVDIPEQFDTREKWYGCGLAVLNQGQCGSCWATSATGVFGERMCVFYGDDGKPIDGDTASFTGNRMFQRAGSCTGDGTTHMAHNHGCKRTAYFLSPQALMSCGNFEEDKLLYPDSAGCNGGEALDAWRYFFVHGISPMTLDGNSGCTPYTSGKCASKDPLNNGCKTCQGVLKECEDTGLPPKMYRVDSYGWIMEKGLSPRADTSKPRPESEAELMKTQIRKMQIELMTNGPLHVCIDYFDNFGKFFNESPLGIYNATVGPKTGGHCLSVVGWGTDKKSGLDYWTIKNTWGDEWGSQGTFRFLRGVDLCGVESDVWVGCPEGSSCELTEGVVRMESRKPPGAEDHPLLNSRLEELYLTVTPTSFRRVLDKEETRTPSRQWRGGYWHELSREDFSTYPFVLRVTHAYEQVYGRPTTPEIAAETAIRVWTQAGVSGVKVRVQFPNPTDSDLAVDTLHHHAPDGTVKHLGN